MNSTGAEVSTHSEDYREFYSQCPICSSRAVYREAVYELPRVGRALLASLTCPKCGYKRSDVTPLSVRKRVRIYYAAETAEDLNARVFRSSAASIEIPELGVVITPGVAAQMTVANVEGVLQMVLDTVRSLEVLEGRGSEFAKRLKEVIRKGGRLTLIIDDSWGISWIEPPPGGFCAEEEVEGDIE